MSGFHHRLLPTHSTLLAGRNPPDDFGFQSDKLQIWYNNTADPWVDDGLHAHQESDECFIVLQGALVVEVAGERITVQAGEFCCFPQGVMHAVVAVRPPIESLMIRAPSVSDKVHDA